MKQHIRIATRGSELALWQANHVQEMLAEKGWQSELVIIKTKGDQIQHLSLDKLEGKGFFTKEIEDALLNGEADLAVHSHKDLPTEQPQGLVIAAVSEREDPAELLLIRKEAVDQRMKFSLKAGAVVGTSSARRKVQLRSFRRDVELKDLRGNVPTRVNKLREGRYDAILIAAAGVERLQLDVSDLVVVRIDPKEIIPAPAQGVLALQIRAADKEVYDVVSSLNSLETSRVIALEREVLRLFHGGCQMPVGVYAQWDDEKELYSVHASRATSVTDWPVNVFLQSANYSTLPQNTVDRILQVKPDSVFITREVNLNSHFRAVLEGSNFKVQGWPLIETKLILFNKLPECSWIFFASKQAVKYFFRQSPAITNQKFGCIGKSTAEALRAEGRRAEFIGASTDTRLTGKQFAARVGSEKVLFPQAKGSLRSVQQQFVRKEQVIDLPVYETIQRDSEMVPECGIMVFTSPSNVEAFFKKYKLSKFQRIVAMGDATAAALREHGIHHPGMPDAFDEAALARAVFTVSGRNTSIGS